MKKRSLLKIQFCLRALLLCGVLGGLLFSGGEGIRLIPFPAAEAAAASADRGWQIEKTNDYQKNIYRFDNQKGNCQPKVQKDHPDHGAGYRGLLCPSFVSAASDRRKRDFPGRAAVFRTRLRTEIFAGRPPPFSL